MQSKLVLVIILNFCLLFSVFDAKTKKTPSHYPPYTESIPSAPVETPLVFVDVAVVANRSNENSIYADILNHCSNPFAHKYLSIMAHENIHDINNDIRNAHSDYGRNKVNGFYVLNGKGYLLKEPNIRKNIVASYIPQELREYRFKTYVTGMTEWDNRPLYLVDEYIAYISESLVLTEEVENNRYNEGWTDGVLGSLEFSIYCVALSMAVKEHDPEYWQNNPLREFILYNLKRAYAVYKKGSIMPQFKYDKQDKLLLALRTSPDAEPMRKFLKDYFQGVWLKNSDLQ